MSFLLGFLTYPVVNFVGRVLSETRKVQQRNEFIAAHAKGVAEAMNAFMGKTNESR